MKRLGRAVAALGIAAAVLAPSSAFAAPGGAGVPADAAGGVSPVPPVAISKEDADRGAALVASEDRRLLEVRTISTLARWQNRAQKAPYRLSTPEGYTLVLTPRAASYRLSDLLTLEPQTLVRLSDGSYLLSEHIVVLAGAELELSGPTGLTLRLASSPTGFVSIVSMGGRLKILGTAAKPIRISSWNAHDAAADTVPADGRAYLRAVGGQLQISFADLADLGFWSGRTGGVSLTGTNRPNTGSLDTGSTRSSTVPQLPGTGADTRVIPTGPLPAGNTTVASDPDTSGLSYVSGRLDNVTVTGNAFGLFVSGADGVYIDRCLFTNSQITGVDLHRFVSSSIIQRTSSNYSGGDGFSLGRATQGIQISQSHSIGNARDGFVVAGQALADGPSAMGSPINTYGNNSVTNSVATGNRHYGIHVADGFNVSVTANRVSKSNMGIVVNEAAHDINVTANQVSDVRQHGIALLNGVRSSHVTGNVVNGGRIYLRDSQAWVQGNTVLAATGHGISVVGAAAGSAITNNVVGGFGSSAIDTARARGKVDQRGNVTGAWQESTAILTRFGNALLQPLTLLWGAVLVFVVLSMVQGLARRSVPRGTHPYGHQMAHLQGGTA